MHIILETNEEWLIIYNWMKNRLLRHNMECKGSGRIQGYNFVVILKILRVP
jgi:hypothetical protein